MRTIAKSCDDPSYNQVSQAKSRALKNGANDHNRGTQEDHFPSAEEIANEDSDDSANKTANVVTSDRYALNGRNVVVSRIVDSINLWKLSNPASEGQKATHHALVITKEAALLSVLSFERG
jgi:hypothetical protein